MSTWQTLLNKLHGGLDPYAGFPADQWAGAWYDDPGAKRDIFRRAIDLANPGLIIEVGSFVGESTIFMANHLKQRRADAAILAVDTWMGGIDHWQKVPEKLRFHFGRPSLFYQFMGNVIKANLSSYILPLSLDSLNAARLLTQLGIKARMIYVDGSHEMGDVLRDYLAYWPLLESGGVFLVDDLTGWFPGVVEDWTRFTTVLRDNHEFDGPTIVEGEKGMIIKR